MTVRLLTTRSVSEFDVRLSGTTMHKNFMTQSPTMKPTTTFANELSPTVATLATMAELCVKILQHITSGELRQVFPLSDELRSVRARLSDQLAKELEVLKDFKPTTDLEMRQLQQLKLGIGIVSKYDEVHNQWVKLLVEPDTDKLIDATIEQWHVILEKRLPRGWDRRRDLLVIHGEVPESLRAAIDERLQERVLVYQPVLAGPAYDGFSNQAMDITSEPKTSPYLEGLGVARKVKDLRGLFPFNNPPELILELAGPYPPSLEHIAKVKEELKSLFLIANVSKNTIKTFGPRWFNQGMENLPVIAKSQALSDLGTHFAGLPMIMVSPGPSLDKNIADLKRAIGKAVLVAPVQSMRRLHSESIHPDFFIVIDPLDLTSEPHAFIDLTSIKPHQALIVGGSCHPNVLNAPFARKYVFGSPSSSSWLTDLFGDKQLNTAGTSVAVTAFNIGLAWQCNPIILVGQDLAFTDGIQYAGQKSSNKVATAFYEIDGYHGGKVSTSYGYKVAHYEFEMIVERVSASGDQVSLINATEGGACIKGFTQQPLKSLLGALSDHEEVLREKLQSAIDNFEKYPFDTRLNTGKTNIRRTLQQVNRLRVSAVFCRQITLKLQKKGANHQLVKLDKEEQKLRKNLTSLGFLSLIVQEEVRKISESLQTQSSLAENLDASIKLFDIIIKACDETTRGLQSILA